MTRKLTKEQRDELRKDVLPHGYMEILLDDLDEADRELASFAMEQVELRDKLAEAEARLEGANQMIAGYEDTIERTEAKRVEAEAACAALISKRNAAWEGHLLRRELEALRALERAAREVCRLSDRSQDPWVELKKAFTAVDALRKGDGR